MFYLQRITYVSYNYNLSSNTKELSNVSWISTLVFWIRILATHASRNLLQGVLVKRVYQEDAPAAL